MIRPLLSYDKETCTLDARIEGVMGTRLDVVMIGASEAVATKAWDECAETVISMDQRFSRFIPDSEISTINRSEPLSIVPASDETKSILQLAMDMCQKTLGKFDITLGEGAQFRFDNSNLIIPGDGLKIDLGGLVKGVAVDCIRQIIASHDITTAFISFGGSSIAGMGTHPRGDCWRVGIIDPFSGHQLRAVDLRDSSLSISGNSRNYRGHIIDPATGRSVTGRRLSAVVAPSATDAEVLSTTWLVADENCRAEIMKNFDITEEFVFN